MIHLRNRAGPADLAAVQHGDIVGNGAHGGHVVGDGHGGGAHLHDDLTDQVVDDAGHDRVQPGGGLVEKDNLRLGGDGAGQPGGQPILSARMAVTFARPLDRHSAMAGTPPQIDALTVENVDAAWGEVALGAEGALTFDAAGIPDGVLSLRVTNWTKLLDAGERAGFLPPSMRGQVDTMLRLVALSTGSVKSKPM